MISSLLLFLLLEVHGLKVCTLQHMFLKQHIRLQEFQSTCLSRKNHLNYSLR